MDKRPETHQQMLGDPTAYNIGAIAKLEREALHRRTLAERVSDGITGFIGSIPFVMMHLLVFATWVLVNLEILPIVPVFDPFPFGILTLIVSTEGVFLTIFVLISQNRMSRQSDRRAHLELQVNLLAEQELTMILRLQQQLCEHFGIGVDAVKHEAEQYTQTTDVKRIVEKLDEELSTD